MPTNRRFKSRAPLRVGALECEHFATGPAHLLAMSDDDGPFRCWICSRGIDAAETAWRTHRDALVGAWQCPFPMFGSCWFDRARLPALDPAWPELHRQLHRKVEIALRRSSSLPRTTLARAK